VPHADNKPFIYRLRKKLLPCLNLEREHSTGELVKVPRAVFCRLYKDCKTSALLLSRRNSMESGTTGCASSAVRGVQKMEEESG
jgi:hypothetical protein